MEKVANSYASALLSIALDENKNAEYRTKVKELLGVLEECEDLNKLLHSSFVSKEEKKSIFTQIFEKENSPTIRDFIYVIIDNSRGEELVDILKEFVHISNQVDQICEGIVYSTTFLSKEEMVEITSAIEKKLNCHVELKNRLDASLIGGVKVIVDNYIFDGSIRSKLKKLKSHLQEGKA